MSSINEIAEQARKAYGDYEPETATVEKTIEASELKAGDRFSYLGSAWVLVEGVRAGSAKMIVKVDGKKTELRFDPSESLVVRRDEVTEEAKAHQRDLFVEYRALEGIASRAAEPTELKAKIAEALEQGHYDRVAEMSVELVAGERVRGEFLRAAAAVEAGRLTAVEAKDLIIESMTDAVVAGYDSPTWSGGFTVTNTINQAITDARRDVVKAKGWGW